jgi:hypothetical protein
VYTSLRFSHNLSLLTEILISYLLLHDPASKASTLVTHFIGPDFVFFWKMISYLPPTFDRRRFCVVHRGRRTHCRAPSGTRKTPILAKVILGNALNILSLIMFWRFAM